MQLLDTLASIEHDIAALQEKMQLIRASITGNLYSTDILLTRKEAAFLLERSPRTLDRLCAEGKIKRVIHEGQIRISKTSVMIYKGFIIEEDKPESELSELDKIIRQYK